MNKRISVKSLKSRARRGATFDVGQLEAIFVQYLSQQVLAWLAMTMDAGAVGWGLSPPMALAWVLTSFQGTRLVNLATPHHFSAAACKTG